MHSFSYYMERMVATSFEWSRYSHEGITTPISIFTTICQEQSYVEREKQSGEAGIRTLGTREGSTVFETAPIDHSGTSPVPILSQMTFLSSSNT